MSDEPSSQYLSGRIEYQQALDTVIGHARHTLRIFDYDLHEGGYNALQRYELLKRFLVADTNNRLFVVLHSVDYLNRECPRMNNLLREHSYAVFIHQTNAEACMASDPLLIADDLHYVHRFHYEQPRAELVLNDHKLTQPLLLRFEDIWHASTLAVTATTIGL
jgi:hypothetical protein